MRTEAALREGMNAPAQSWGYGGGRGLPRAADLENKERDFREEEVAPAEMWRLEAALRQRKLYSLGGKSEKGMWQDSRQM